MHDDPSGGGPGHDPWANYPAPGDPAPDADSQRRMERRAARLHENRRSSSSGYDNTQRGRQNDKRSRLVAVAVLVAVAIVLAVAMFAGSGGAGDGASETVPFSLVPLTPEYLQEQDGSVTTSSSTTSTTVSSSPAAAPASSWAAAPDSGG